MKIAVCYEDGNVFPHFGHTEFFKLYETKNGKILASAIVPTDGAGHGALAEFLRKKKVSHLICGNLGGGARMALDAAGISVAAGVEGKADDAVRAFLANELIPSGDGVCRHHENGCDRSCGKKA